MKNLFTFILLFIAGTIGTYAQMGDDSYVYGNNEITLSFTIIDGGWGMENIVITHAATGKSATGTGEWLKVNTNAIEMVNGTEYTGPDGWYQIEANGCYYEFNEASDNLELSEDCSGKSKQYILTSKK